MNIVVCISQTPDTATRIVVGADGKTVDPKGVKYVLNPYDEFGIEESLRRREADGGTVTLLSVGGDSAKETLRLGLAMGADKGLLIRNEDRSDSFAVASALADAIREIGPDLVFAGRQSVDYDSAQIGPMLAELLGIPCVSFVIELDINGTSVRAVRDIEGGREIVETTLPCIITTQKGLNEPRYPKLPDIMKAKSKPIDELAPNIVESRVTTLVMNLPSKKSAGKILDASPENVRELVRMLHEEAKAI